MPAGRPAEYTDPADFADKVDKYLESCRVTEEQPTITGLALYLGFESRQSFYDYQEREGFSYTVKRSRLKIEHVYEKALFSKNCVGAIFGLKNMGWKDKTEVENSGKQTIEVAWDKSLLPPTD